MTENQQISDGSISANVDIVYCIDATADMQNCFDAIKKVAKTLHADIVKELAERAFRVEQLRVKVIAFRDFCYDGEDALQQSKFFNLPDETAECEKFIDDIRALGGGDFPASALEALHLAMNSDWVAPADGVRTRHIIVMFTDAPAHRLDDPKYIKKAEINPLYPKNTPADLNGILDEWNEKMGHRSKRLLVFAPDAYPWGEIGDTFNNCIFVPANVAEGLNDVNNEEILKTITHFIH